MRRDFSLLLFVCKKLAKGLRMDITSELPAKDRLFLQHKNYAEVAYGLMLMRHFCVFIKRNVEKLAVGLRISP